MDTESDMKNACTCVRHCSGESNSFLGVERGDFRGVLAPKDFCGVDLGDFLGVGVSASALDNSNNSALILVLSLLDEHSAHLVNRSKPTG